MAPRKTKKSESETGLLAALRFIKIAQQNEGTIYQTHCRFINEQVVGFNGILAAGFPVSEFFPVCPHTFRLIDALERATGVASFTALDTKQLAVKSDKFRALISCVGDGDLTYSWPDAARWPLNDAFKKAAELASIFNKDGAQTVLGASVITQEQSVVGVTRQSIIEAWHGLPMPPGLVIPVSFIDALSKIDLAIERFGFSEASLTVYFTNGAWLKTQLYQEKYPDFMQILSASNEAKPSNVPKQLADAIKAVLPFCETSSIFFIGGQVQSHKDMRQGASYDLQGINSEIAVDGKALLALLPVITQVDFSTDERVVSFFGDKLRGVLAQNVL